MGASNGPDVRPWSVGHNAREFVYEFEVDAETYFHLRLWDDEGFLVQAVFIPLSLCCGEEVGAGADHVVCGKCYKRQPLSLGGQRMPVVSPYDDDDERPDGSEALTQGLEEWLSHVHEAPLDAILQAQELAAELTLLLDSYSAISTGLELPESLDEYFRKWRP